MTARILSIGTATPPTTIRQEQIRDFFAAQPCADRLTQRLIRATFDAAQIDHRFTVIPELGEPGASGLFVDEHGVLRAPGTALRNAEYIRHAPDLSRRAAEAALAEAGVSASDVTHVITVSCTGCFAPGPDFRLVRDLGLAVSTERYHLGFIGCAAAFPALRAAERFCAARPDAVVLVVCTELCSLHVRPNTTPDQIVSSSVFGDGSAAAVITAAAGDRPGLDLDRFATTLTDEGESDMAWTIGDDGFEMILTAEVPRIVGREIRGAVDAFLGDAHPDAWAVHPGGRSILDRVESGLGLDPSALAVSRDVLRRYGNMSSATVMFILRALLHDPDLPTDAVIAGLAFGPGLSVESALLTVRGARPARAIDDGDAAAGELAASATVGR